MTEVDKRTGMRTMILFLGMAGLMHTHVCAQGEANVWAFGTKAGIDFNSGNPVALQTGIDGWEGCASICDASGQLLFYTEGRKVWNRNHVWMPNGVGLLPSQNPFGSPYTFVTASQQAVIAPVPGDASRYYIFSLEPTGAPNIGRLHYSIVDMTLNGGLGDVVAGQKAIQIDSGLQEKMTLVAAGPCNSRFWLITMSRTTKEYMSYEITPAGINTTPVRSAQGLAPASNFRRGVIRVSHDRKKMTVACNNGGLELYDFDPQTGIVSNARQLDTDSYYGIAFSPDNTKMYTTGNGYAVHQFNLDLPSAAAISASRMSIFSSNNPLGDIKLAPDGKIYFNEGQTGIIHAINFPDLAGTACQPMANVLLLLPGTQAILGFPNDVPAVIPDTFYGSAAAEICPGGGSFQIRADTPGHAYTWDNGDTGSIRTVTSEGVYTVRYFKSRCAYHVDTFVVRRFSFPVPGYDNCTAWIKPLPGDTAAYTYTWTNPEGSVLQTANDSRRGDTLQRLVPGGTYEVRVEREGCDTVFRVNASSPYRASFTMDSVICEGAEVLFENTSEYNPPVWVWQFDNVTDTLWNPVRLYPEKGIYRVQLVVSNADGSCPDTASRDISVRDFQLSLRASEEVLRQPAYVTLATSAEEPYVVEWWSPAPMFSDPEARTQTVWADTTTQYTVAGRSYPYGCPDSVSITVKVSHRVFVPTAFTPGGDGKNDRFRPLLGSGVVPVIQIFRIFDRWGNLVYNSMPGDATGWDGHHAGAPAETGTYFYMLQLETPYGTIVEQKGDVTLIR